MKCIQTPGTHVRLSLCSSTWKFDFSKSERVVNKMRTNRQTYEIDLNDSVDTGGILTLFIYTIHSICFSL